MTTLTPDWKPSFMGKLKFTWHRYMSLLTNYGYKGGRTLQQHEIQSCLWLDNVLQYNNHCAWIYASEINFDTSCILYELQASVDVSTLILSILHNLHPTHQSVFQNSLVPCQSISELLVIFSFTNFWTTANCNDTPTKSEHLHRCDKFPCKIIWNTHH